MRLDNNFIESIKERSSQDGDALLDLVSKRTTLKRTGSEYVGLCPSHEEKTPSFNLNVHKCSFYCHSCGFGGHGVIDFLMKSDNLGFLDAVREAAKLFSMPLVFEKVEQSREERELSERKRQARAISNVATAEYKRQLAMNVGAVEYLKARGITAEDAQRFHIGYAPKAMTLLRPEKKLPIASLLDAGLINRREGGNDYYEVFRDRVMIPIMNMNGDTIGFTARTMLSKSDMPEGAPYRKYINSANTLIFEKKAVVFGLFQAIQAENKRKDLFNITEGALDVIACHRHGFSNTGATLGTSLSDEHVQMISRRYEGVRILRDSDSAGIKASLRDLHVLAPYLSDRFTCSFVSLPNGDDPDSLLVKPNGAAILQSALDNAASLDDFLVNTLYKANGDSAEGVSRTISECREVIRLLKHHPLKVALVSTISKRLNVSPQMLAEGFNFVDGGEQQTKQEPPLARPKLAPEAVQLLSPLQPHHVCVLSSLLSEPDWIEALRLRDHLQKQNAHFFKILAVMQANPNLPIAQQIKQFADFERSASIEQGVSEAKFMAQFVRDLNSNNPALVMIETANQRQSHRSEM